MRLRQPDRRTCGAAALVMARRLAHPRYAALVADQATFARETVTLHRRLTSLADTTGGWQVPWPRALGTPPWAVARERWEAGSLDLAGWDRPWLVISPR